MYEFCVCMSAVCVCVCVCVCLPYILNSLLQINIFFLDCRNFMNEKKEFKAYHLNVLGQIVTFCQVEC